MFLFILWEFHKKYLIIFFPSAQPIPNALQTPPPAELHALSLSSKAKHADNKNSNKETKTYNLFGVGQLLLGAGPVPKYEWYPQYHSIGENLLPFLQQLSVVNSFIHRRETSASHPCFPPLCWAVVCCEFICRPAPLCLKTVVSLESSITSGSYNLGTSFSV